jgi:predicted nucleic acid-binding protein
MTDKVFIDTNILVYAYDRSESVKQPKALVFLDYLATRGLGVISAQVLGEFFNATTRKMAVPLNIADASKLVAQFIQSFDVVNLTGLIVLDAMRGVREHQMSYWDALIWASARLNQIPIIFSEDFSSNVVFEGVRIVNPFAPDFQLADWV